mgnify:CR=1 FL=1
MTFAKSEPKTIIHHVQADQEQSSEDEFNGYAKVVVSQNLAEEILDEIFNVSKGFIFKYDRNELSWSVSFFKRSLNVGIFFAFGFHIDNFKFFSLKVGKSGFRIL